MRKLLLIVALCALALPAALATASHRPPKTITVKTGDDFFSPTKKTIHKRDVVKWQWVNEDRKAGSTINEHTITEADGKLTSLKSKTKTKGTYSFRFKKTGTFTIVCAEHPDDMIIKVKVKD